MDYSDTAIICLCRGNGSYEEALRQVGFPHIIRMREGDPVREGFNRALAEGCQYLVTVDEKDGFSAEDVRGIADALHAGPEALYAGVRKNEGGENLPARLFGFLSGLHAGDANTSLLGMSAAVCGVMLRMRSGDAKFFLNIPLEARANDITVTGVETGAANGAQPGWEILARSLKLYFVFVKFSIAAFLAYLVDIGTFYLFEQAFGPLASEYKILYATVLSRVLCSAATYILNRGAVFKSHNKTAGAVVRFVVLSVGQLLVSWLLVLGVGRLLGGGDVVNMMVKVVVDLVIFIASFSIQRDWVFKKTDGLLN
jgi:putative flippase GtrA